MARPVIPDPLTRRHLVEGELDPKKALRIAEAYLEEGRDCDAVPFLGKAEAREQLEAVRERAVESGDAFLLRQASGALGDKPGPERWRSLAANARRLGKEVSARDAERQAELDALSSD
jgi:hypothetical protein